MAKPSQQLPARQRSVRVVFGIDCESTVPALGRRDEHVLEVVAGGHFDYDAPSLAARSPMRLRELRSDRGPMRCSRHGMKECMQKGLGSLRPIKDDACDFQWGMHTIDQRGLLQSKEIPTGPTRVVSDFVAAAQQGAVKSLESFEDRSSRRSLYPGKRTDGALCFRRSTRTCRRPSFIDCISN
ncbi:MAG: hypothetical protein ABI434_24235 [Burkholderiaceae bacterium]